MKVTLTRLRRGDLRQYDRGGRTSAHRRRQLDPGSGLRVRRSGHWLVDGTQTSELSASGGGAADERGYSARGVPPNSFAYQWNRDGKPIPGATSPHCTVQIADSAHTLTCTSPRAAKPNNDCYPVSALTDSATGRDARGPGRFPESNGPRRWTGTRLQLTRVEASARR